MKQFWIDFVEGRISVPEMLGRTEKEPELLSWLTGIADPRFKTLRLLKETEEGFFSVDTPVEFPFDAKLQIQVYINEGHGSLLGRYLNLHGMFSDVLITAFPDAGIVMDNTLSQKFTFMITACPDYIGGREVDHLLDQLLEEVPQNLSKTKRVKLYKDKVKALFHITGRKFPYWIQSPDWPISPSGKPMRFLEQKREKGDAYEDTLYTHFLFEDVDTGEIRIVDQFT